MKIHSGGGGSKRNKTIDGREENKRAGGETKGGEREREKPTITKMANTANAPLLGHQSAENDNMSKCKIILLCPWTKTKSDSHAPLADIPSLRHCLNSYQKKDALNNSPCSDFPLVPFHLLSLHHTNTCSFSYDRRHVGYYDRLQNPMIQWLLVSKCFKSTMWCVCVFI